MAPESTEPAETSEIPEAEMAEEANEVVSDEEVNEMPETEGIEFTENAEGIELEENKKNKNLTKAIIIGVIVVVIAAIVAVFAVFGKTWFNPYNKGHIDVTGRTTEEVADVMGLEYNEFLEMYGLPSDMPKNTNESAASYLIPAGVYAEMNGASLEEFAEFFGWDDSITEDTPIGEALDKTKLSA